MGLLDSERLAFLKKLRPSSVRGLGSLRMEDVVGLEAKRARARLKTLRTRYPSAGPRELGQHVIDSAKGLASLSGSVSGIFGLISVPADLVVMTWL
ncbi:MAG: EcsC family protein, partial [Myxococcaceae bacterium]